MNISITALSFSLLLALGGCGGGAATPEAGGSATNAHEHGHEHSGGQGQAEGGEETAQAEATADGEGTTEATETSFYGEAFTLPEVTLTVSEALARGSELNGQEVTIRGEVADVCQKAGCWAVLREGEETIRILSKNHGFGMPKDGRGREFVATGILLEKEVDPDTTAHYASESEHPEAMPETGKTRVYSLDASGVAQLAGA